MAGIVAVFDFDKTIIDVDSDNWVVDKLGCSDLFNTFIATMPWNTAMDMIMMQLHSQKKTVEDIKRVLKRVPIHHRVISAITRTHALGCDMRIVSDANSFFIDTILEHHGLKNCFWEINTNPSFVDENGRLRILPYHTNPHGCPLCPPNMCKGLIINRIQDEIGKKKKIIYLGDGVGDFCPVLKLNESDFIMPRKNFPMWNMIRDHLDSVKAQIHGWCDGAQLEQVLVSLLKAEAH